MPGGRGAFVWVLLEALIAGLEKWSWKSGAGERSLSSLVRFLQRRHLLGGTYSVALQSLLCRSIGEFAGDSAAVAVGLQGVEFGAKIPA